jgi:hypothetical protein
VTVIGFFDKILLMANTAARAGTKDLLPSDRALAFRGWRAETDEVVEALRVAGITPEVVETTVPAIIGGALLVCESYVQARNLQSALRIVAPIVRRHTPI